MSEHMFVAITSIDDGPTFLCAGLAAEIGQFVREHAPQIWSGSSHETFADALRDESMAQEQVERAAEAIMGSGPNNPLDEGNFIDGDSRHSTTIYELGTDGRFIREFPTQDALRLPRLS